MTNFEIGNSIRLRGWPKGEFLLVTGIKLWDYIGDHYTNGTITAKEVNYPRDYRDWELVITELDFYKDVAKL